MDTKALIWLVFALALLLTPIVFAFSSISTVALEVLAMYAVFAGAFLLLYAKKSKVTKNIAYMIGFVAALILPLGFAYFMVVPFIPSIIAMLFVLMHFIFAAGVVTLYSQWAKIKKLI